MATTATKKEALKLSPESQKSLLGFATKVIEHHNRSKTELVTKMDIIDRAYARYVETTENGDGGVDTVAASVACDVFNTTDKVTPPIVVAQVDSFVAYLADVFLSGYPMFPVLGTPKTKKTAEQLETLMDDHALLGSYPRHLLLFLREAVKYNYAGLEVDWDTITKFTATVDIKSADGRGMAKGDKFYNKLKRLDPRNIIRDTSVLPCDVAEHGDYAGYVERLSMTAMKRYLVKMANKGQGFNVDKAMLSTATTSTNNYQEQPAVSDYISSTGYTTNRGVDWDAYADGNVRKQKTPSYGAMYEKVVLYARIIPRDHNIISPQPGTPQIWRLVIINNSVLAVAHRVISAYDLLPILIGQPQEDGFGEQTQSIAEGEIPFQRAAETLFNIRFAAARRAVSDRALYNSNVISPRDVNSKAAAPKIPVNINPLQNVSLETVYKQIPFDMRGTETAISDAQTIVGFSKELHGLNNARTGQFQKGNKSVQEWQDVQSGSENRLRLPALALEYQVFAPMKSMMALNIMQYGEDAELISQKTGDVVTINMAELRGAALSFRIADGFTPKSKMASTEMLKEGMNMLNSSPVLQQAYGASMPSMFAHLMALGGVRGLEEYDPKFAAQAADPTQGNVGDAAIQPAAPVAANPAQGTP